MPTITTSDFFLPQNYIPAVVEKIAQNSVLAALSQAKPQLYTNAEHIVMTGVPLAEYVGESAQKSSTKPTWESRPRKIHKLQTTVRQSLESKFADEDNGGIYTEDLITKMGLSIAQAIDVGVLHGWNPLGKEATANLTEMAIVPNATQVTATGNAQADLDSLPDSVIEKLYRVNGIALDPMFANQLRKLRVEATGARMYPEIGLDLAPGNLDGIRSTTSVNVGGANLGINSGALAIVGDWSQVLWGIVRDIKLRPIEYGDPDNGGDLQGKNEIAYRVECLYAVSVLDPKAFAVLKAAE